MLSRSVLSPRAIPMQVSLLQLSSLATGSGAAQSSKQYGSRVLGSIQARMYSAAPVEDTLATIPESTAPAPPPPFPSRSSGAPLTPPEMPQCELSRLEEGKELNDDLARQTLRRAVEATKPRYNWTRKEIAMVYYQPLLELVHQAGVLHRRFHAAGEVQLCTLMNIKEGGCTEDCSYCAQSTRHSTGVPAKRTETVASVLEAARKAKENGSTRFCMGAAWRDMKGRKNSLKNVIEMIQGVRGMGMEACVTLGMIDADQARQLKEAGLTAYNHNLDTSREFYPSIISTRTFDERLATIDNIRDAGINVCSGGILGLGESSADRIGLLHTAATMPGHPESFPVNALVSIKGTPLGDRAPLDFNSMLRTIATARLVMPSTIIRIAAGRKTMSEEKQALCFMGGANAIFTGERMLTTDCNGWDEDATMFARLGLRPMASFAKEPAPQDTSSTKA